MIINQELVPQNDEFFKFGEEQMVESNTDNTEAQKDALVKANSLLLELGLEDYEKHDFLAHMMVVYASSQTSEEKTEALEGILSIALAEPDDNKKESIQKYIKIMRGDNL